MPHIVITAVGPDRTGLVKELTGYLHEQGANIGDSRMVNLDGQFALLLRAEGAEPVLDAIADGVEAFAQSIGLTAHLNRPAGEAQRVTGVPWRLRTYAMDQPGLVHRVTHLLHQAGVNVEELHTRLHPGSYSGTPLFSMTLRMTAPASVSIKKLRADLEALCDELNCDVDLEPAGEG